MACRRGCDSMSVSTDQHVSTDCGGARAARVGIYMRQHQNLILAMQWIMVAVYLVLLFASMFAPSGDAAQNKINTWHIAKVAFWGIWWPLVILSVAFFGRAWCGLLCPEGALSEWASNYGFGKGIPRWMKWAGWPFVTFVAVVAFGQLTSLHKYPKPTVLVLGGSTLAAVVVGFLYGRGKRVWCRHLCPVAGVFAILAKIAPIHFRVNEAVWESAPPGFRTSNQHAVNCAPLINVGHMESASACHMCGRCAGERGAVQLSWRSPNAEALHGIASANLRMPDENVRWLARLLVFGMIGLALGAFQWSVSPWFASATRWAAGWLVAHQMPWLFHSPGHWWILTDYPQTNDVFTWFYGGMLLIYVLMEALLLGGWTIAWMRFVGVATGRAWQAFACVLVPFAGTSLFVGSSLVTTAQLAHDNVTLPWVSEIGMALLVLAAIWGTVLAWRTSPRRPFAAATGTLMAFALPLAAWAIQFFIW